MLLVPMLRRIARLGPKVSRTLTLPLAARIASTAGRHQFYTVRIENGTAVPAFKASGDITSMSRADGYIEIPADVDAVEAGTPVEYVVLVGRLTLLLRLAIFDGVADVLDGVADFTACLAETTLNLAAGFLSFAFGL